MTSVETQFYTNTKEAWVAMLDDCTSAHTSIDFEQYIFTIDSIGSKFIDVFKAKAKVGVKVRILCDAVGSYSFYNSQLPEELRTLGIEVRFFNPVSPWRIANFTANFFRDHRKITIVDNVIGYTGGVGIDEKMVSWRDTHIRIVGPIIKDLKQAFDSLWNIIYETGTKRSLLWFKKTTIFVKNFTLLTNAPRFQQLYIYYNFISSIQNAKKYIYLTTPYFVPDTRFLRALRLAAKRGLDVRLLVPQVADHLFIDHARQAYFTLGLRSGIRIFRYQNKMMHAKTAVIDDEWATVGSFNLDNLSFFFNHEINLVSTDKRVISTVKQQFLRDLTNCKEVLYDSWIKRPLKNKILEILTLPFHKFF